MQLHGETARRLEADEKPLQIQNDYLFQLGFGALWRVQEEGLDSEVGCLIRFYAGKAVTCTRAARALGALLALRGSRGRPVGPSRALPAAGAGQAAGPRVHMLLRGAPQ